MIGRDCLDGLGEPIHGELEPAAAQLGDPIAGRQQGARRGAAAEDQHGGPDEGDMALHEGQAGGDLVGRRLAIAGRPPKRARW